MGIVRMDIDEVAAIVTAMRDLLETCFDEWSDVGTASSRALFSTEAMNSALATHLPALSDLSLDLQRRRDLAILLNSNGGTLPTGGVLEYTAPADDSAAGVTKALAEAMAEFARSSDIDTDTEAMAALEALLDRYSGQPEVLSAFYTELEPAGLLDLMASLSGPYAEFGSEEYDQRASLLAEVKSTFAAAERTWGDAATAEYAKELVDRASGTMDRPSAYPFGFGGALSYLLYDSNYSDAFLTSAATQIDLHERTTFGGYPSSWYGWTSGGGPNPWFVYFPEDAQAGSYDLGVSFMSALANNPEVGLNFFMEGSQDESVTDRQMYWLHDREWEQDQFAQLSEALLAATTDPRLIQPWDSASAAEAAVLASHTVNLLGHRGISGSVISDDGGPTVAAENFALLISTYMHGVDRMLDTKDCAWDAGGVGTLTLKFGDGEQKNTPRFNRASLDAFIALAGSTETGFATLRGGLDTYAANKYTIALSSLAANPDDPMAQGYFSEAYKSQAKVEGVFLNAIGDSAIGKARGADKARAAWVALGTDLVGVVPFGSLVTKAGGGALEVAVVNFTVGQAKKQGAGAVTSFFGSDEAKEVASRNALAEEAMHRARYQVLVTAAQYPDLLAQQIPGSASWVQNGQPLPWESMGDAAQEEALGWLQDSDTGVGRYFDQDTFETLYEKEFGEFFEMGDG